jgi:flap endonuclease-1
MNFYRSRKAPMTIKGLSAHIKKMAPNARRRVPVEFFTNRKIAIDGHLLSYAYMSTALGSEAKKLLHAKKMTIDQESLMERWLGRWLSTITMMKEAKMKPVVVFDGPNVPIEKVETRAKRRKNKEDVREEIKLMEERIRQEDLETDTEARERMVKLIARNIIVTEQHFSRLRNLLETAGVSVLQAEGEGEALCATLVKEKKCYAIFTQDSDAGPYLAPVVISDIENPTYDSMGARYQFCEVIYYQQVMTRLELTANAFIDFCIMCGSDYNDNIPNWGPAKCYKLIKEYKAIENIPVAKYDPTPLNYVRIREIFAGKYKIATGELQEQIVDIGALTRLLAGYGLLRNANRLLALYRTVDVSQINGALAVGGNDVAQAEVDPGDLL